jgi:hypothetical protein
MKSFFSSLKIIFTLLIIITSCKKEEPPELNLTGLMIGDVDLLASSSPEGIPVNPVIIATFTSDVNLSTVTINTVKLVQVYNNEAIGLSVTVDSNLITIIPLDDLCSGADYKLIFSIDLKSAEGGRLKEEVIKSFKTDGTFAPVGAIAHWTFEDNANDIIGNYDPLPDGVVAITYTPSRNAAAGKAATFDGDYSIIEIPNADPLIDAENFTFSFWMKTNSSGHVDWEGNPATHYVLGLGMGWGIDFVVSGTYELAYFIVSYIDSKETPVSNFECLSIGFGAEELNGGSDSTKWMTKDQVISLYKDNWLHVVYTFDGYKKTAILYLNGEIVMQRKLNACNMARIKYTGTAPDVANELAFGFFQSRKGTLWDNEPWGGYDFPTSWHFKGQLDDIRIYHKTLTPTEVYLMYESEKP